MRHAMTRSQSGFQPSRQIFDTLTATRSNESRRSSFLPHKQTAPSADGPIQVPNIMFTIEPGTEVGVFANVADLVVAQVAVDGVLRFSWNSQVASGAFSGGVKITTPADQLRSVVASLSERRDWTVEDSWTRRDVQILEGFTSIDTLEVSSAGHIQVWASLTDVQNDLSVKVDRNGRVDLKSGDLKSLAVHGDGAVFADVDGSVDNLDVTGSGHVILTAPGGIKNGSVDAADGRTSRLNANSTVTGRLTAAGAARVFLPSCANVSTSGEAKCFEELLTQYTVRAGYVDTSRRPATRQGTHMCAVSAYDDSDDSTSSNGLTLSASLAVLSAVATSFMV